MSITNGDKGGVVVIWKTKDYISEANRQLNVISNYKKLSNDPRVTHNKLINDAIDQFKQEQLIPKETAKSLKIKDPETSKFHMLLKIHKINNPEGQVVSSIGYHSTNILKFVDCHLKLIVKNIPSYVEDSNNFLNKIDTAQKVPNSEEISAVKAAYESYPEKLVATKVIITF